MIEVLLVMLLILGFFTLELKDLQSSVICLAMFSLICSLLFYLLHAPDVAIAEASVGTGVGTVVFIWAVKSTERWEGK